MRAITTLQYGPPDVLQMKEVEKPIPKNYEILVRNYATTVTTADTMIRKGKPYIGRLYLGLNKLNKVLIVGDVLTNMNWLPHL